MFRPMSAAPATQTSATAHDGHHRDRGSGAFELGARFEWIVEDAFRLGYRVGIVANSDGQKAGRALKGRARRCFGGLWRVDCGCSCQACHATAVFEALRARRHYATTGRRGCCSTCARPSIQTRRCSQRIPRSRPPCADRDPARGGPGDDGPPSCSRRPTPRCSMSTSPVCAPIRTGWKSATAATRPGHVLLRPLRREKALGKQAHPRRLVRR